MTTLSRLNCPSCGSPLEITDESPTIKCPFCGNVVAIPEELRPKRAAPAAIPAAQAASSDAGGEIIFQDDFSNPDSGWETGDQDGIHLEYTDRGYRIFLKDDGTSWESYADQEENDFSVEVEVTKIKGPRDGSFGLVCRAADDGSYSFEIDGEGYYGIYKNWYGEDEDDEDFDTLAENSKPGTVRTGDNAANLLRAVCQGAKLILYVNGQKVLEAEDDEFGGGDVGVLASTGDSGRGKLDVVFKNFVLRKA